MAVHTRGGEKVRTTVRAPIPARAALARRSRQRWGVALALLVVLLGTMLLASTLGPARTPLGTTAGVLLRAAGVPNAWDQAAAETQRQIILNLRLPRILAAMLAGAALALSGSVLQTLFRNPLADPGIIGVSAGGALGAVAAIALGGASLHWLVLPAAAFAGALLATGAVFLLAIRHGRPEIATLLLAGVAVTYLCSAVTSAIISFTSSTDLLRDMVFWLLGGFDNRSWEHVRLLLPAVLVGSATVAVHARSLNVLLLGEEDASSLGVDVGRARTVLILGTALMTGVAVAISGLVGFVGLVVPHVVRLLVGPDHRVSLPLVALGGAWYLLLADTLARIVLQPSELRVGIVTAFVGAPFFLIVLRRGAHRLGSL